MTDTVSTKYPNLFRPIELRGKHYRNRILTAPTMFAHSIYMDAIREGIYRMCERRAAGGAAQVSTGEICVNFEEGICAFVNRPIPFVPGGKIDFLDRSGRDFQLFREYARRIQAHGAIALLEFSHELSGSAAEPPYRHWGPDAFVREDGVQVYAITEEIMEKICGDFAVAARFTKACGFDGMLLHGGHGFLFQQFLSPRTNHRTDQYGGSMENRARFPRQVLEAIRQAAGEDFILEVRLSAEDGVPGGLTIDDTVEFCRLIDGMCDIIHVSNGLKLQGNHTHTFTSHYDAHGYNVPFARRIKEVVKRSKVSVIGGINSPELAEEILASGAADFIEYGRQGFADPDFPKKALHGQEHLIRRCVRCFQCYPGGPEQADDPMLRYSPEDFKQRLSPARMGKCAINPEADFLLDPASFGTPAARRRVLVIGGGPAGMQAALTASSRGHQVILCERSGQLGGLLRFTDHDPDKEDLRNFRDTLIAQLKESDVEVRLYTEVDASLAAGLHPDYILAATGSKPKCPPIPGIASAVSAWDTYFRSDLGRELVIVGGGLVGCETGLALAARGHRVTILEAGDTLAPEAVAMYRNALMEELEKRAVTCLTNHACLEFAPDGVWAQGKEPDKLWFPADQVIYSLGMEPVSPPTADGIPMELLGDCAHVGKVGDAISSAYRAAMAIL